MEWIVAANLKNTVFNPLKRCRNVEIMIMENQMPGNPEGGLEMTLSDKLEKEIAAYETDTFEDLSVQDALTIIAVFAAQMDPDHCEEDVSRIGAIEQNYPVFVETKGKILKRINKFVNSMTAAGGQLKAIDISREVLTPKLRKTAFELAVEVALSDKVLTAEKNAVLETLKTKLSIDSEFAQRAIDKFMG
jgi:hypothetical protein